jgi:hypothetical protein
VGGPDFRAAETGDGHGVQEPASPRAGDKLIFVHGERFVS